MPATPAAPAVVDATRCALCGEDNNCAAEREHITGIAQPPCWCLGASFSAALHARVPPSARGRACICARCCATALPAVEEPMP